VPLRAVVTRSSPDSESNVAGRGGMGNALALNRRLRAMCVLSVDTGAEDSVQSTNLTSPIGREERPRERKSTRYVG
jgi:hypothetical protein